MPSGPTYYDFFGVSRAASADEIRSAYLWLMKQYHPDLTDGAERDRAAHYAAILNRSYDILKDPLKRANYDAWLDLDARSRGKKKVRRALLTGETGRKTKLAWDVSTTGAAALGGFIVILLAAAMTIPGNSGTKPDPRAGLQAATHLDDAGLREQVRLAIRAAPDEAQSSSESCFEAARETGSVRRAEACIAFDDAYLEWNQSAADVLSRPTYFNDAVVRLRHRNAMGAHGSFDDARLMQLRQRTLNALLGEISSKVSTDARGR
jgi:curved DNA-binding protein CbpA